MHRTDCNTKKGKYTFTYRYLCLFTEGPRREALAGATRQLLWLVEKELTERHTFADKAALCLCANQLISDFATRILGCTLVHIAGLIMPRKTTFQLNRGAPHTG